MIEHGRGCYVVSEDGGGISVVEPPTEMPQRVRYGGESPEAQHLMIFDFMHRGMCGSLVTLEQRWPDWPQVQAAVAWAATELPSRLRPAIDFDKLAEAIETKFWSFYGGGVPWQSIEAKNLVLRELKHYLEPKP